MESANKQLGTTMLVSARTIELAGEDGVLVRPVGQICVVGRDDPVVCYEILCRDVDATDRERRLAKMTGEMVNAFREVRLNDCVRIAEDLDYRFGPSKLTALYRERCEFFLSQASLEDFDCTITLAEK
jgi:adenylate cyclase